MGKVLRKVLSYLKLKETWVIFLVMGIIMMNYPFINIFNGNEEIFGLPPLYLYLFIGWMLSIFIIYLFMKAIDIEDADKEEKR